MYGDWGWLCGIWSSSAYYNGHVVESHYAYRNVKSAARMSPWFTLPDFDRARIKGVSPDLWVDIGAPVFKTQKQLGGRAVVTDSFSRHLLFSEEESPGNGIYAHREGYNVLYGDWSAKWYGDPQQRTIWWPQSSLTGSDAMPEGMAMNSITDYSWGTTGNWAALNVKRNGAVVVWHNFDVASGVDVGVDE